MQVSLPKTNSDFTLWKCRFFFRRKDPGWKVFPKHPFFRGDVSFRESMIIDIFLWLMDPSKELEIYVSWIQSTLKKYVYFLLYLGSKKGEQIGWWYFPANWITGSPQFEMRVSFGDDFSVFQIVIWCLTSRVLGSHVPRWQITMFK